MRAILLLIWLFCLPVVAAKPESECKYIEVVKDGQKTPSPYLKCLIRGESARTVIRHSHQGMQVISVYGEQGILAWEFYGAEMACAARTTDLRRMQTLDQILENLPSAEALCLYYLNPRNGQVEANPEPVQESSAGVSNNF